MENCCNKPHKNSAVIERNLRLETPPGKKRTAVLYVHGQHQLVWLGRRSLQLMAALCIAGAGLLVLASLVGTATPAAASECRPRLEGSTTVVVVVKAGSSPATQRCVELTGSVTGFDALRAAGHSLRIEGGFLCAIDGVPATGCAQSAGFDGTYWRYFTSSNNGTWAYSPVGAGRRLGAGCMAEGWVYSGVGGTGQPPVTPAPVVPCTVLPNPTTTTAVPVTPPPTTASPAPPGHQPVPPNIEGSGGSNHGGLPAGGATGDPSHGVGGGGVGNYNNRSDNESTPDDRSNFGGDNGAGDTDYQTVDDHDNGLTSGSEMFDDTNAGVEGTTSDIGADGQLSSPGPKGDHSGPERVEPGENVATTSPINSGSVVPTLIVVAVVVAVSAATWWRRRRGTVETAD